MKPTPRPPVPDIPGIMRASDLLVRRCRDCGCTDANACVEEGTGVPCHWVDRDLCSACKPEGTR